MLFVGVPLLLAAMVVQNLAAEWQPFSDSACRESNVSECSDPCPHYDHVILPTDNKEKCKALCDARKDCTGIEYNGDMRRCEIWKIPIGAVVEADTFECHKFVGPAKEANRPIEVTFKIDLLGNYSEVVKNLTQSLKKHVSEVLRSSDDQTGKQVKSLKEEDVRLVPMTVTESAISLVITILPREDVNPLAVFALLRGANDDGIPDLMKEILDMLHNPEGGESAMVSERDLVIKGDLVIKDGEDDGEDDNGQEGGSKGNESTNEEDEDDNGTEGDSENGALRGMTLAVMPLALSLTSTVYAA